MSKYVKFYFNWGKRKGILLFDGQLGLQRPKQFEILEIQISRQKFLYWDSLVVATNTVTAILLLFLVSLIGSCN